jgi:hypothetical protein
MTAKVWMDRRDVNMLRFYDLAQRGDVCDKMSEHTEVSYRR